MSQTRNDLPFTYVGNGNFWLGDCNPDFIHSDKDRMICIEMSNTFNRDHESYAKPRIEKFERMGWKCLVFFGEKNRLNEYEILHAYRALGYISKVGVTVKIPRTFPSVDRNAMMRKEATDFNQW